MPRLVTPDPPSTAGDSANRGDENLPSSGLISVLREIRDAAALEGDERKLVPVDGLYLRRDIFRGLQQKVLQKLEQRGLIRSEGSQVGLTDDGLLAIHASRWRTRRHVRDVVLSIAAAISSFLSHAHAGRLRLITALTFFGVGFAVYGILRVIARVFDPDRLLEARSRAHRCLVCGYDLRGITGRCPECGTPIPPEPTGPRKVEILESEDGYRSPRHRK